MSGIVHSLLVLAGLRAPRRAPSARLRGKGATAQRNVTPPKSASGRAPAKRPDQANPAGKAKPAAQHASTQARKPARQGAPKPGQQRPSGAKGAPPAAPNRTRPGAARTQPSPGPRNSGAPRQQRPSQQPPDRIPASVHEAIDDVFGELSPLRPRGTAAPRAPVRPQASRKRPERAPARHRSVSGLGMFALATACLSIGGWVGGQVQAYAYSAAPQQVHSSEMVSIEPPSDFKF